MFTKQNIFSSLSLLGLDFLWLGLFMGSQYKTLVKKIQGSDIKFNLFSAFVAYLIMLIGLNVFVNPNLNKDSKITDYLKYGFLFGIVVYGVYDFTCGGVFKDWDFKLAIVDVLWGGLVYFGLINWKQISKLIKC